MEETLVFIDEGFLSKLSKHLGKTKYIKINYLKFAKQLSKKQNLFCKKIFYYTAPPYQSEPPSEKEELMKKGYDCFIKSLNENECSVFLKETDRSKRNLNTNSFCITKTTHTTHLDSLDENYLDQETVPVVIISTDEDSDGSEKINSEIKSIAKDGNSLT